MTKIAKAKVKNIRVSYIKLNLLAKSIRGLNVSDAINELSFSNKAVAVDVKKALISAISNAQNNHGLDVDLLYVDTAVVGKAVTMKRFHARAKGRGAKILKPFSHLFITLKEKDESLNIKAKPSKVKATSEVKTQKQEA